MYIAYGVIEQDGIEFVKPIGILRNKKDADSFKDMSPDVTIEYIPSIDMSKVTSIKYINFYYYKDGSYGWSEAVTNSFFVKDVEKFNRVNVLKDSITIVRVLNDGDVVSEVVEELKKVCSNLLNTNR